MITGKKQGEGYWKDGKLESKKMETQWRSLPNNKCKLWKRYCVIYNMDFSEKENVFIFKDGEPIKTNEQSP